MDLFIHLGLTLGLRHGEILGLQWPKVDFDAGTITIDVTLKDERRSVSTGNGIHRQTLQTPKTKSSRRILPITNRIRQAFIRHQHNVSFAASMAGDRWRRTEFVFVSSIGTPLNQSNNLRIYKKMLSQHDIRFIRPHDMRHTFATLGLENNIALEKVSQTLGHSDINITKSIYAPFVKGYNEEVVNALDEFIGGAIPVIETGPERIEAVTNPTEIDHVVKYATRKPAPSLVSPKKFNPNLRKG
jgi:integrase